MKPKLPFKLLILDVDGVLTDGGMYYSENGDEFKKFNTKDGMAIKHAVHHCGITVGFISHGKNLNIIANRAKHLGVTHVYCGKESKLEVLRDWTNALGIHFSEVAAIGDDVNDIEILKVVGFSACPADAVTAVKEICKTPLTRKGGEGCVREFVELYTNVTHV